MLENNEAVISIISPSDQLPSKNNIGATLHPIGDDLREARLKAGYNLEQIAQSLRISKHYLTALEENDVHTLPERVYTLGFLRSYARYLGFNTAETVQRFKTEVLGDAVNMNYSMPKPLGGDALPRSALIWITTSLVMAGMIGGWFYFNANRARLHEKAVVPDLIKEEILEGVLSPSLNSDELKTSHALQPTLPPDASTATASSAIDQASSVSSVPTAESAAEATASPALDFTFTELCWMEIKDEQDNVIISRNFNAGETYNITPKAGMKFSTGNAGGIQIKQGAQKPFTLGKHGEIIKNSSLDSNRFKQF